MEKAVYKEGRKAVEVNRFQVQQKIHWTGVEKKEMEKGRGVNLYRGRGENSEPKIIKENFCVHFLFLVC